jgi:Tfp pilus assembly protein PilV
MAIYRRRGLTLVELMVAMTCMMMIVAAMGALAKAVQLSADYSYGHATANQHALVAMQRIDRNVGQAAADVTHPGAAVLADTIGSWRFPDTLVVWKSDVNQDSLPQVKELVVYCPNPQSAHELLEITAPTDSRTVSLREADAATLKPVIDALKTDANANRVVLTELLRTATLPEDVAHPRGAVRFELELRPSASQWDSYKAGTLAWTDLPWVQGIRGATTGLRQTWVRYELQLMPGETAAGGDPLGQQAVTFYGSATLNYELNR